MLSYRQNQPFSEFHFQMAMQEAGVGLWDWDVIHDQQSWTDECKVMFGLSKEAEVNQATFLSLIHPDDRAYVEKAINTHLQKRFEPFMEFRIVWPDGSVHWIASRGRCVYDSQGTLLHVIGVAFDITAQKESEEAQRRTNRRLFDILENVGEAFALLDKEWRFVYVNAQAASIGRNVSREELYGKIIWEMYPEIVGIATERYFRQVMQTRQPAMFEIYYSNLQRWYDIRVYPAENEGIAVFAADITRKKALEEERDQSHLRERFARIEAEAAQERSEELVRQLEQKQAFLQAIIDQAPIGIIMAEAPSGKLLLHNDTASQLLGHTLRESDDYTHYTQYEAVHPDGSPYRAEEYPLAQVLLSDKAVQQGDLCYRRCDGSLIYLAVSAAPIRNEYGRTIAALCVFHDVSERYELERRKDEFIGIASHELRTPLTSIKGNLQLMARRLQKLLRDESELLFLSSEGHISLENIAQWIERALRQANTESRLIDDLLDATRVQEEKLRVILEMRDLASIVIDAVNDVLAVEGTRTIDLTLPDQPEIPVMADKVRIGQVIANYLANALRHSHETQPVHIHVSVNGHEARVEVSDTGPGLSLEAQRHIWDRFYQMPDLTGYTGSAGGLGLGLYISQALIHLHGGQIGVDSEPGRGTTFWFTLPLLRADR